MARHVGPSAGREGCLRRADRPTDHGRQGTSYTLGTVLAPPLLKLDSATSAWDALCTVATTAEPHLNALTNIAGAAFVLAFTLSPRGFKHPYLLYTTGFVLASRLTPLFLGDTLSQRRAAVQQKRKDQREKALKAERERAATRRMEASYEVLGASVSVQSDEELLVTMTPADSEPEAPNGELIRRDVELFAKGRIIQAATAGIGFAMAVVGIWGDGVFDATGGTYVIEI